MMITCTKCARQHPLTEEDVKSFFPRFFCLSCGTKLPFDLPEAEVLKLVRSNDPARRFSGDLSALPPQGQLRKVAQGASDLESNG